MLFPFAMARPAPKPAKETALLGGALCRGSSARDAFFTMLRGPQLAHIAHARSRRRRAGSRYRLLVLVPLVGAIGLVGVKIDQLVELLQMWSGEESSMLLVIKGEPVHYTGTSHRLLQLRVYEEAVAHAGWFGYGSVALAATDVKIPYIEEHLRQMFFSIDNHYLQFVLQNGYVGITLFLVLCLTRAYYAATSAVAGTDDRRYFVRYFAAMFIAVAVLVFTVWLASDYRFVLLAMFASRRACRDTGPRKRNMRNPSPFVRRCTSRGYPSLSLAR